MTNLKAPLRDILNDPLDPNSLKRVQKTALRRCRVGIRNQSHSRRISIVAAMVSATAVALIVLWYLGTFESSESISSGELLLADGGSLGTISTPESGTNRTRLDLADGSILEVAPGTLLETLSNSSRLLEFGLVQGTVTFEVQPGGSRRWLINAGEVSIEVVGTRFRVERTQRSVIVSVSRGTVVVRSDILDRGRRYLEAGETIELNTRVAPQLPQPLVPTLDGGISSDGGTHQSPDEAHLGETGHEAQVRQPRVQWRTLAKRGEYQRAFQVLGPEGFAEETKRAMSMNDLLALADVARRSGHPRNAIPPLERALSDHPNDRRAPVAAFTLGRLELDVLGRPARAARAFQRCIELGAPQALRADSYARLAIARDRSGDRAGARAPAEQYLRMSPEGRRAGEMRRILGLNE